MRQFDELAQAPIVTLLGVVLIIAGVIAVAGFGAWCVGFFLAGLGLLMLGAGGEGSWESPLGKITGGAGLILAVVGLVCWLGFR